MNLEMRRAARMAMRGVPERLGLEFARGNIEMRAKPNGTGGTAFTWEGYASVYDTPFPMWDQDGEPFDETVALGAAKRSLNNPSLDVPFLIGHNNAGIPLARTKSGTMTLSDDSHGVLTYVPAMDGHREEVRALASAVERGDLDEMSLAFVCTRQAWDAQYEHRTILEMDLHRGDVCAVTHGANPATAGVMMRAVEQLAYRRPAAIGAPRLVERRGRLLEARMPTAPYERGADEHAECGQCSSGNDVDAAYCDQCGHEMNPAIAYTEHPDDTQVCPWCRLMNGPDAKVCDQCGRGLTNDHDGDDPGYSGGVNSWRFSDQSDGYYGSRRPLEQRAALSTADVNELPDSVFAYIEPGGTKDADGKTVPRGKRHFPLPDRAHVINALARAPQSPFGGQAMPAIKAAAAKMGIGDQEQKALGRPLEQRASAAEDTDLATAPDTDAAAAGHTQPCKTCASNGVSNGRLKHPVTGANGQQCPGCGGTGAVVMVDDATGIPGDEAQMSAARRLELRLRELDMQELASRR
jgi:hypothetical protein